MTMMTGELLIIVIPIVVVEVILAILALLGIHRMYGCRNGNKTVWTVVVLLIQIIGPILYFVFGKGNGDQL